jgi:hypothetical protein
VADIRGDSLRGHIPADRIDRTRRLEARAVRRLWVGLACAAALIAGVSPATASSAPPACGTMTGAHTYAHVIVIMEENLGWTGKPASAHLYGSADAPYINGLMQSCSAFEAAGATDPSQPNYMAATSGAFDGWTKNPTTKALTYVGPCNSCYSEHDNVFHQLDQAGLSWRVYAESMTQNCQAANTNPRYKTGHNPAYWYTDLTAKLKGGDGSCAVDDVPYVQSGAGLGTTLPSLAWVAPDICDDMHWGSVCPLPACLTVAHASIQAGDQWIDTFLTTQVFNRPDYQNGSTLVILTWDEGNEAPATGCSPASTCWFRNCADPTVWVKTPSCRVGTVLLSPWESGGVHAVPSGAIPSPLYSHYSILQLIQQNFGLPALAAPSPPSPFWNEYQTALPYPD